MKKYISLLFVLILAGCATPYQEYNEWKNPIIGGYTDIPLSEDTYLITMHGNKNTTPEQVFMMLFYRASGTMLFEAKQV